MLIQVSMAPLALGAIVVDFLLAFVFFIGFRYMSAVS
jgi:hypothetical protein